MALGLALASQPTANAFTITPKGKIVLARNADVIASCKFEVNKVDKLNNYDVTATLTANARPAGLDGYRANRFTQVFCYVYDTNNNVVMSFAPSANGPTVVPASTTAVLAYQPEYTLCTLGFVKLKNGDSSFTPFNCA
jgi:hypothetical protein